MPGPTNSTSAPAGGDLGARASAHAKRTVLVVAHTGRPKALRTARLVVNRLTSAGMIVRVLRAEADQLGCQGVDVVPASPVAAEEAELVIVVGGDGTLLRAAELARPAAAPLLGVNFGSVGFLAEAEPDDLVVTVEEIVGQGYAVEERMTIDVLVRQNGAVTSATWALNEATVEKAARERMVEVVTEIDGRPLSRWSCDGVVCATPTGSTAYALSAGGPVLWPDVKALLLVPISAHALFSGPMVVSPDAVLAIEVIGGSGRGGPVPLAEPGGLPAQSETSWAVMWCDGRRRIELAPGARVEVRRGAHPVILARLPGKAGSTGFTNRLVEKFGLSVTGWRGRRGDP